MHLFTWNVGKRIAMAPHALKYLERIAERDHVIATLQEWPWQFPDLEGYPLKLVPTVGKALILYSSGLELRDHSLDDSGRATVARFRLNAGNEITCVGLHWHSRNGLGGLDDHYERGGAMALFRHHLENRLGQDTPAVIMGDFNANSHDQEMASPYCLFAQSKRDRSRPSMESIMGQDKRPWRLVEPEIPAHVGTYYWPTREKWIVLDHVVLTPSLAPGFLEAEVLTEIEGHRFLTPDKQVPRGAEHASDHLPVVCKIHYQ